MEVWGPGDCPEAGRWPATGRLRVRFLVFIGLAGSWPVRGRFVAGSFCLWPGRYVAGSF